jgi:hypothetical protein
MLPCPRPRRKPPRVDAARPPSHLPAKQIEERPMKVIPIDAGLGALVGMLEHVIA